MTVPETTTVSSPTTDGPPADAAPVAADAQFKRRLREAWRQVYPNYATSHPLVNHISEYLVKALRAAGIENPDPLTDQDLYGEIATAAWAVARHRGFVQDDYAVGGAVLKALEEWSQQPPPAWQELVWEARRKDFVNHFALYNEAHAVTDEDIEQPDPTDDAWIEGLLYHGQPGIVAGPLKSMKSSLVAHLAAAVSAGKPFLGLRVPDPARVLILTAETKPSDYRRMVARTRKDLGAGADAEAVEVMPARRVLRGKKEREEFEQYLRYSDTRIVVIDPLYRVLNEAATNSIFAMGRALSRLVAPILEADATPLLVHHSVKVVRPGELPRLQQMMSGAGVAEWARSWVLLNRQTAYDFSGVHKLFVSTGSSRGSGSLLAVEVDERPGGDGRPGLKVSHGPLPQPSPKPEGDPAERVMKAVRRLAKNADDGKAQLSAVGKAAKLSGDDLTAVTDRLVADGKLQAETRKTKGWAGVVLWPASGG